MSRPHDQLRAALKREPLYGPYRLVLELGRDYSPRRPPAGIPQGIFMSCFYSAFTLAEAQGLRYCEGWATAEGFLDMLGRPHAWCIDDAGLVIDSLYVERAYDVAAYRGVVISLDVARPHVDQGSAGTLVAYADRIERLGDAIRHVNQHDG